MKITVELDDFDKKFAPETPWTANLYHDDGESAAVAYGSSPSAALRALADEVDQLAL